MGGSTFWRHCTTILHGRNWAPRGPGVLCLLLFWTSFEIYVDAVMWLQDYWSQCTSCWGPVEKHLEQTRNATLAGREWSPQCEVELGKNFPGATGTASLTLKPLWWFFYCFGGVWGHSSIVFKKTSCLVQMANSIKRSFGQAHLVYLKQVPFKINRLRIFQIFIPNSNSLKKNWLLLCLEVSEKEVIKRDHGGAEQGWQRE